MSGNIQKMAGKCCSWCEFWVSIDWTWVAVKK